MTSLTWFCKKSGEALAIPWAMGRLLRLITYRQVYLFPNKGFRSGAMCKMHLQYVLVKLIFTPLLSTAGTRSSSSASWSKSILLNLCGVTCFASPISTPSPFTGTSSTYFDSVATILLLVPFVVFSGTGRPHRGHEPLCQAWYASFISCHSLSALPSSGADLILPELEVLSITRLSYRIAFNRIRSHCGCAHRAMSRHSCPLDAGWAFGGEIRTLMFTPEGQLLSSLGSLIVEGLGDIWQLTCRWLGLRTIDATSCLLGIFLIGSNLCDLEKACCQIESCPLISPFR